MRGFDELEISVEELKKQLDKGKKLLLIDVREPWEFEVCRIEGAKLFPMRTIPTKVKELSAEETVICYCHHGHRSLNVVAWLRAQGLERAKSLAGGIEQWSLAIDPRVPRY